MKSFTFILIAFILISCSDNGPKECSILGNIVGRDSEAILLMLATEDSRSPNTIEIPIKNNQFQYTLQFDTLVAYKFIFKDEADNGAWKPIEFIPEDGTIKFTLHSMDRYNDNKVEGSEFTTELWTIESGYNARVKERLTPLYDQIEVLKGNNLYYSDSMLSFMDSHGMQDEYDHKGDRDLNNKLEDLRQSWLAYSDTARTIWQQIQQENRDASNQVLSIAEERLDIVGYYLLLDMLVFFDPLMDDINRIADVQSKLTKEFNNHPYNELSTKLIASESLLSGGKYFDFTLLDTKGQLQTLSNKIDGKWTLLQIWAPWCGPCIKSARELKPIYNKYKNQGLVGIAVLGRYDSKEKALVTLEKQDHPWLTLLDDEWNSDIWTNYGLKNAGGGIFLINSTGHIVEVYPSADEVDAILSEVLL